MSTAINITTPVGRMVKGSLYKPNTTDADGAPLVFKHGPNVGQPRVQYFFALAIPKGQETYWSQTEWGKQLWALGNQCFPSIAASPSFAWKIDDGDSQIPNKKGHKPCDSEGYPGHWVIRLSNGFAPRIYRQEGGAFIQETEVDFIKPGYWIQVALVATGNGSTSQPGIYLNPSMVCLRRTGTEISFGPDVNEAGFGVAPLPAAATAMPEAIALPTIPAPAAVVATPPPPPAPVVPDPAFLNVKKMTAKAGAVPYASYIDKGWTDELLIQHGFMEA